ncbi:MAG: hypothetical protein LBN42_03075, partial [Oscillospiraceae bacterium]|nr:hypothetical protein [Oscillospiraceae bacterium]
MEKYKVKDFLTDFSADDTFKKEVYAVLKDYKEKAIKSPGTSLPPEDNDLLLSYFSAKNQSADFNGYFARSRRIQDDNAPQNTEAAAQPVLIVAQSVAQPVAQPEQSPVQSAQTEPPVKTAQQAEQLKPQQQKQVQSAPKQNQGRQGQPQQGQNRQQGNNNNNNNQQPSRGQSQQSQPTNTANRPNPASLANRPANPAAAYAAQKKLQ